MKTKNRWFQDKNIKCVVLAAGKGSRLLTLTKNNPKPMVSVVEKPILEHVINYWKQYTNNFVFVVNYKKEKIIDYVKNFKGIRFEFVVQKKLRGIADALLTVESLAGDRFIVVLGDCICRGEFNFPSDMEQGVGILETNNTKDIKNSYSIKLIGNVIDEVKEKPKRIYNNLCGLGFYFFDKKIFNYVRKTPPSQLRDEIELTDVIQNMIMDKEKVHPVVFKGDYININTESELNRAKDII
mgnify:FL=1